MSQMLKVMVAIGKKAIVSFLALFLIRLFYEVFHHINTNINSNEVGAVGPIRTNVTRKMAAFKRNQSKEGRTKDPSGYYGIEWGQTQIPSEIAFTENVSNHAPTGDMNPVAENESSIQAAAVDKSISSMTSLYRFNQEQVNCSALFANNRTEFRKAKQIIQTTSKIVRKPDWYTNMASNCTDFIAKRKYLMNSGSKYEVNFPIAFNIVMYQNIEQAERLLRAIYRPWNYYCIHVDKKAEPPIHDAISTITNCFNNVNMASRNVTVTWGKFSVLEANLICMADLYLHKKWKYYINLTGHEFPLRTNLELVQILRSFKGADDVKITNPKKHRWIWKIHDLPYNMNIHNGEVHVALSRDFVHFVLYNEVSWKFLQWVHDAAIPDEIFFATLHRNPHLGIPGNQTEEIDHEYLTRYKVWKHRDDTIRCHGKYVRNICIFGIGDLPALDQAPHIFANKLHLQYQQLTFDCLEQRYFKHVQNEYKLTDVSDINTPY